MKKGLLFLVFVLLAVSNGSAQVRAQVSASVWYDGYWGKWQSYGNIIYGNYSSMVIHHPDHHPSDYQFKFVITNFNTPTKDEMKWHLKNNEWYQYDGYVEYYVTDKCPTIKDVFKFWQFPSITPSRHRIDAGEEPCAKRTAKAIIRIKPYKDHPSCYNFWFDDVAFAVEF